VPSWMLRRVEQLKQYLAARSLEDEIHRRELLSILERSAFEYELKKKKRTLIKQYVQIFDEAHTLEGRRAQVLQGQEMRCVTLLAHVLPQRDREEWLGELTEMRCNLIQEGYSRWGISCITWMWVLYLGWTLIKGFNFSKKKQQS
jgi:hypothetical protein